MIDVIIPTYNRVVALQKVIDSYLNQEQLGKIIIIDDCSTDNTEVWMKEFERQTEGRIVYYRTAHKTSLPQLRNIGVSMTKNPYIFMGEDDVLLPPDHFQILLQNMEKYDADIIAGRRIYLYENESITDALIRSNQDRGPIIVRTPFEGYFERYIDRPQQVPFIHSNSLMKREVLTTIQYDPWYAGNAFREESDFYLRATDAGFLIWITPDTLSYHLKNTSVNKAGGSRKKRLIYEYQVWKNTMHLFLKNRRIFETKFGVKHIRWFAFRCLCARYTYAIGRRIMALRRIYEKR